MRRFIVLLLMVALLSVPVAAVALAEPYSSSTTTVEPSAPVIVVAASGLSVSFSAAGVTADCTWDLGDGQTGTGNPVDHVYAADGDYTATATCGDTVITRDLTFTAGLSFTGFGLVPFGVAIAALVLLGAAVLWLSRRARARS